MSKQTTNSEITYNWDCRTVDVYPKTQDYTDVVYNVHYIVWGTDDSVPPVTASRIGTQGLNIKDITDFIPFSELTNEQTVTWTKSSMGEDGVSAIESDIAEQIALIKNPVSVTMTIPEVFPIPPIN